MLLLRYNLIIELMAICREVVFGRKQIEVMLLLYRSVFLSRLLYNCEAWSNLSKNNIKSLQASQLSYLRCVMGLLKSTPFTALYLELGILPVNMKLRLNSYHFSNVFLIRKLMTLSCSPIKRC